MNDTYKIEDLGIDLKSYDRYLREKSRERIELERTIKKGSGILPESVKLFNKYVKYRGYDPLTARKYHDNREFEKLISKIMYEIDCTVFYCKDTFGIELDRNEAVTIACKEFVQYYEEGYQGLTLLNIYFPKIVTAVKTAHLYKNIDLNNTKDILKKLNVDIPDEVKLLVYIQNKYKKNQKRTALKDIIQKFFAGINNKNILNTIASNALH